MYRSLIGLFALSLLLSADTGQSSSAAGPANSSSSIGTVSGSGGFSINGASLANGVPSWPIMSGDQITTGSTAAVITLPDGTQLDLDPKSQVTITVQDGMVKIIINAGGCHERDPHHHRRVCWVEPFSTSSHRCDRGHGFSQDPDGDNRCCPGS